MKLVNIEIFKDELERLIRNYRFYSSTEAKYRYEAYKELSEWLDGFEVGEPSKDLEEAAEKYAYTNWQDNDYHNGANKGLPFDAIRHTEKAFIAGAKWYKEHLDMWQKELLKDKGE